MHCFSSLSMSDVMRLQSKSTMFYDELSFSRSRAFISRTHRSFYSTQSSLACSSFSKWWSKLIWSSVSLRSFSNFDKSSSCLALKTLFSLLSFSIFSPRTYLMPLATSISFCNYLFSKLNRCSSCSMWSRWLATWPRS